ncbi:hypothetical protein QTG54_015524 [Skeletonema marinoi]|uniref:Uncharacterized protein n=1 Tax=Skeletonema marinoi TaxID=267567 RepID=A0AAD9D4U6_9STRA|nr:hypothetical protein QTG54_015524 [Skeletonema marinoi]
MILRDVSEFAGAALRFHARFEAMKAEKIGVGENPLGSSSGERDGIEWNLPNKRHGRYGGVGSSVSSTITCVCWSCLVSSDTYASTRFGICSFCASAKKDKRANGYGNESTASDSAGANWSIPGCHVPVSSMIHSWLATCQAGWPVPNEFEGGKIPSHTENISTDPSEDRESPIPPKEIVLSATNQS